MSKLCKFTFRGKSFSLDPDDITGIEEDVDDGTCRLALKVHPAVQWVEGPLDLILSQVNENRSTYR